MTFNSYTNHISKHYKVKDIYLIFLTKKKVCTSINSRILIRKIEIFLEFSCKIFTLEIFVQSLTPYVCTKKI